MNKENDIKIKLFADSIDPVSRNNSKELFFIQFEVLPKNDNPESSKYGGAYANLWINTDTIRDAEKKAIDRIKDEGWKPYKLEEWKIVCRDCYTPESYDEKELRDILEQIDEAFEYGISLSLYTWPLEEENK